MALLSLEITEKALESISVLGFRRRKRLYTLELKSSSVKDGINTDRIEDIEKDDAVVRTEAVSVLSRAR